MIDLPRQIEECGSNEMRNTQDSDPPREPLKLGTSSETKQGKCCLYIRCSGNLNFLGKILWEER